MSDTFKVTLKSSGRTVELRPLDGLAQIRADMCVSDEAPWTATMAYRAMAAIVSIAPADGGKAKKVDPFGSKIELEARFKLVSGRESDELVRLYMAKAAEHDLPKASGQDDEQPT